MENNVTSLEVSKKLKEAGFKAKSEHSSSEERGRIEDLFKSHNDDSNSWAIRRYQVNEILAELPKIIEVDSVLFSLEISHSCSDNQMATWYYSMSKRMTLKGEHANTLQDSLALMWIWLKENGYLKEEL